MLELAANDIRNARLTRRLRGYDREETEELLAIVAESYEKVHTERRRLSDEVAGLRRELRELEGRVRAEAGRLQEQVTDRERRIAELEPQLARFEEERSKQRAEIDRLRGELSQTQAMEEELQEELRHQRDRVARFAIREKALLEQMAMLDSQLGEAEDATPALSPSARALPERADRAAATLLRLDRVVETLERESRREAETTLKKARERADEIIRVAEARRRRIEAESPSRHSADEGREEYDPIAVLARMESPVAEPEASDRSEQDIGEASWTSRATFDEATGRPR